MRSRSNSGVRLDHYYRKVQQSILKYQNPITGLFASSSDNEDAWVRDNVYSVTAVWALSLAYKKIADADEDRAKAYELEQRVVKLMRGILSCMMRQVDKVELFKHTQLPRNSLHAKYSSVTGNTVVSDDSWGHLQIDATSLYLLKLAQMTASGLKIIFTLDEVAFIQNLIFYIESAYRIPDYGMWERGDKTNHGLPELNASSIGMAKAAMEALADRDLFGSNGGPLSTIHVQADKIAQCNAVLQSMLPRESYSKEVDSGLLSVIGFPAFAVDDQAIVDKTREAILSKCAGSYGCCRFLRDGYKTAIEDPSRLHYEPSELQKFENIECEWPVFYAYLSINESFEGNTEKAADYLDKITQLLVTKEKGSIKMVPEMYAVPHDKVEAERATPRSQERVPVGQLPHKWGQSLYIVSCLLSEGFISPGELDPLNRRHAVLPKPDLVVQIVVLAEDEVIQECLAQADLDCRTIDELQEDDKYVLHPAIVLGETLSHLGECPQLGLTGRYSGVGLLGTSTLYRYNDRIYCFTPELYDSSTFYLAMDLEFLFDQLKTDLAYLKANWQLLGRPTVVVPIYHWMSDFTGELPYEFKRIIVKLLAGYLSGVCVQVGDINDFISTSCVSSIDWMMGIDDNKEVSRLVERSHRKEFRPRLPSGGSDSKKKATLLEDNPNIYGISRRSLLPAVDDTHALRVQIPVPKFVIGEDDEDRHTLTRSRNHHHSPSISPNRNKMLTPPIGTHLKVSRSTSHFPASLPGSNADFMHQSGTDLVDLLRSTEDDLEQADILHVLYITKGPDWDTKINSGEKCTVKDLLIELYHKAGATKLWWLIRYTAGMLRKRATSLGSALTDLLVRQKQVTFGFPSKQEFILTQPLSPEDIAQRIELVCQAEPVPGHIVSNPKYKAVSPHCMLHQELLIYLAMFVRTEPQLFHEMLRIRIGLIIAVMTTELSRCLNCSADEATSHLFNMSPCELKKLLHHILSGREFSIEEADDNLAIKSETENAGKPTPKSRSIRHKVSSQGANQQLELNSEEFETTDSDSADEESNEGQWARRRRIDGALNRVPIGFYTRVWHLLEKCPGIMIEGKTLSQNLIKEMTAEEIKFALQVEAVLNTVPEPEYRQLIVEALITLTFFSELDNKEHSINAVIPVNKIVERAYHIFLADKNISPESCHISLDGNKHICSRLRGICEAFYDTAPSGRCGTMSYLCRAIPDVLPLPKSDNSENLECVLQ